MSLGQSLGKINTDLIRVRSFEMGGHTFKVKVPLTCETEALDKKLQVINEEKIKELYALLTKELVEKKNEFAAELGVEYLENDIIVQGKSMQEAAKNKYLSEMRIVEMFKFLVPEKGHSLDDLTYAEIDELFPFSIQMDLITQIGEVISPAYKPAKGK
jgi:hypothetical protein